MFINEVNDDSGNDQYSCDPCQKADQRRKKIYDDDQYQRNQDDLSGTEFVIGHIFRVPVSDFRLPLISR